MKSSPTNKPLMHRSQGPSLRASRPVSPTLHQQPGVFGAAQPGFDFEEPKEPLRLLGKEGRLLEIEDIHQLTISEGQTGDVMALAEATLKVHAARLALRVAIDNLERLSHAASS
jgi:hypothetical protein